MKTRVRRLSFLLLFVISTLILIWGVWPLSIGKREVQIYPADMKLPDDAVSIGNKMVVDGRTLTLEWPEKLRAGERGSIRLGLERTQDEQPTPTPDNSSELIQGESLPAEDIFDTHYVIAEARLEMPGMAFGPVGQISEGLLPGKPVYFVWHVGPEEAGEYQGTVWLHLRYVPIDGGAESRSVLSAQLIDIQAVQLLWIGGTGARVLGSVGVIVALVAGLDDLLPWIVKQRKNRIQKLSLG